MSTVFELFWFWCGALWMVLIATTIRPKVIEAVHSARITTDEAATFLRGLAISIGFLCGILGVIALAASMPAPFCIEPFSFNDWPSAASNGVTLIAWAALLGWVWLGSGAELLGRIAPAFTRAPHWRRSYSPTSVRLVVTLLLAAAAVGSLVGTRTGPQKRPGICPPLANWSLQPTSGTEAAEVNESSANAARG